jgi:hypothetical protein
MKICYFFCVSLTFINKKRRLTTPPCYTLELMICAGAERYAINIENTMTNNATVSHNPMTSM